MKRGDIIRNLDWITVLLFAALVIMGWMNVFSAVYDPDNPSIFDFNQRYGKQFVWISAAFLIAILILFIDSRFYEYFSYVIYASVIVLLILVLIIGTEVNNSKSWIAFGNIFIQPAEFAKPAVALALAKYLSSFNLSITRTSTLLKASAIIFLPIFLIMLQPDTGTALIFFAFILPLYREGLSWLILLVAITLVLLFFLVLILPEYLLLFIIMGVGVLALWIATRKHKWAIFSGSVYLISFGLVFGVSEITGLKYDLYTSGLVALIPAMIIYMIFVINNRLRIGWYIFLGVFIAVAYTFTVDYGFDNVMSEYQRHRVNIMLGLKSDPLGAGYNVNQSKIAIGSGGFTGKGFLQGTQTKLNFVPEQSTDFIFCTVGEEWGFVGSVTVIGLFTFLLLRLIKLAERQRSVFSRVYGYGVISILMIHFFVNVSMTIGLFPVIGIPLPFFSYGGSALWAFTILLFIFLRLDTSRKEHLI